jgi:hypothetical protein
MAERYVPDLVILDLDGEVEGILATVKRRTPRHPPAPNAD